MVEPATVDAIRAAMGDARQRVLVTGGSGFVGSHLAQALADAGHEVSATARNRFRSGLAFHPGVNFVEADLCDAAAMRSLARGCDLVFHSGGLVTPWADARRLREANVQGTQNLVEACLAEKVQRLIHVSSTSVFFDYCERRGIRDEDPLPRRFACPYAASKAEAERVVLAGVERGLNAVIVRARAVIGPGDTSLLPRIVQAARRRRLRVIGGGGNEIDLTYIDNLVYALALAAVRGGTGLRVTVTNDEPVRLWRVVRAVVEELGLELPRRRVPHRLVHTIAGISEAMHRFLPSLGEPELTRYSAGLLAMTQTFDQTLARQALGYAPLVKMPAAIGKTIAGLRAKNPTVKTEVKLRLFSTGFTMQSRRWIEPAGGPERIPVHASFALIDHPAHGPVLFDTGYAPRFFSMTSRFPFSLYARITRVEVFDQWTAAAWVRRCGIRPEEIGLIILSHFHADHIGGLRDFLNARFVASATAWDGVRGRNGFAAVRRGFIPDLLPGDFQRRVRLIDRFGDDGIGPFERTHDLFGDGSIRLIELPGHARGMIGALLATGPAEHSFLIADATWSARSIPDAQPPPFPATLLFDSARDFRRTLCLLRDFRNEFPNTELIATHCPDVAARLNFETMLHESR